MRVEYKKNGVYRVVDGSNVSQWQHGEKALVCFDNTLCVVPSEITGYYVFSRRTVNFSVKKVEDDVE